MKIGKTMVDQVDCEGNLEQGYDVSLSPSELFESVKKCFPDIERLEEDKTIFVGCYKGKKYAIRCKNITYLGNPHPLYKKRIQISEDLETFYNKAISIGAQPILLGVYSYSDNTVFVDFRVDTYVKKKAHNSSAHVYVSDLAAATEDGFFQKTDYFGNDITAFRPDMVKTFLDDVVLGEGSKDGLDDLFVEVESTQDRSIDHLVAYAGKFSESIIPLMTDFFHKEKKDWNGISCYKEMIADDYRNKFQPEWAAFYLEYEFEKYIAKNKIERFVRYEQDKTKGGIDLDLYFPMLDSYGDLKAHSLNTRGIPGNDWGTVSKLINGHNANNHVYYIICEHTTEKDSLYENEVAMFWNKAQNKANLLSYADKMKHNVQLIKAYFLDINANNKQHLTVFKQGVNSNGKPRPPKIMVGHDDIDKFLIKKFDL